MNKKYKIRMMINNILNRMNQIIKIIHLAGHQRLYNQQSSPCPLDRNVEHA